MSRARYTEFVCTSRFKFSVFPVSEDVSAIKLPDQNTYEWKQQKNTVCFFAHSIFFNRTENNFPIDKKKKLHAAVCHGRMFCMLFAGGGESKERKGEKSRNPRALKKSTF